MDQYRLATDVNNCESTSHGKVGLKPTHVGRTRKVAKLVSLFQATPQDSCPYLVIGSPNGSIIDVSMSSHRRGKAQKKCDGLHDAIFDL